MLHDLPHEILEYILDFLHDDPQALRGCSLVHRSWLPATRYHLLSPTIIGQFTIFSPNENLGNVTQFLDLISSPHCTIHPAIEDVILFFAKNKENSLLEETIAVLSKAPSLKKVVFVDRDTNPISWIAQKIPDIQELVFEVGLLDTFVQHDAIPFITSFTGLRSLSFYESREAHVVPIPPSPGGNPLAFALLRTLRLRIHRPDAFFGWLLEYHSYMALEMLVLSIYSGNHEGWEGVDNLNRFLKAQSNSLKHLYLAIDYTHSHRALNLTGKETAIDLSVLRNLQLLGLRHHNIDSICDVLGYLTPSSSGTLQSLTIDILRWKLAQFPDRDCGRCPLPQLAGNLGTLIGGPALEKVPAVYLRVPKSILASLGLVEALIRGHQPGSTTVSPVDDDGYMVDSMDSLVNLIMSRMVYRD